MRDVAGSASETSHFLPVARSSASPSAPSPRTAASRRFNAQVLRRTVSLRNEKDQNALQVASGRKAVAFLRFGG